MVAMVQLLASRQNSHNKKMKTMRKRKEQRVRYSHVMFTIHFTHLIQQH